MFQVAKDVPNNRKIYYFQFRFQEGHSTYHQFTCFTKSTEGIVIMYSTEESFQQKQYTMLVFVDLTQTFDSFIVLWKKMQNKQPEHCQQFESNIRTYLDDRTLHCSCTYTLLSPQAAKAMQEFHEEGFFSISLQHIHSWYTIYQC